ncbi:hypothetical protein [Pseudoalteromonas rubra]|uniref:hypothetical protein n=1 Tax=Pseudoalteromonas rubra TaxID=43658 RepID=UPI002DBF9991|nr:hypothetical protein [Pseudoalteromonas rubra]MEC4089961.1 hypothetical protein [Pseudoalteromonas rubra]
MLTNEQQAFVEERAKKAIADWSAHLNKYGRILQGGKEFHEEHYNTHQVEYFRDLVCAHFESLEGFVSEIGLEPHGRYLNVKVLPLNG